MLTNPGERGWGGPAHSAMFVRIPVQMWREVTTIEVSGSIHPTKHLLCAAHSLKCGESKILKDENGVVLMDLTVPQRRHTSALANILDAEQ